MGRGTNWPGVLAATALLVATAALIGTFGMHTDDRQGPTGVCVVTNPYALGTDGGGPYAAVQSVTAPVRVGGVVTCESGSWVSVTPK